MEFESLACRLVHDACRLMYRVPSLFLAFATWHDDSETTPETTTREKKLQLITLRPTIFYFFHQCQLHSFHENAFHNCVLSHGFFFLYWFALSLVIYQPRARLAFVRQWFFDNIITTQLFFNYTHCFPIIKSIALNQFGFGARRFHTHRHQMTRECNYSESKRWSGSPIVLTYTNLIKFSVSAFSIGKWTCIHNSNIEPHSMVVDESALICINNNNHYIGLIIQIIKSNRQR